MILAALACLFMGDSTAEGAALAFNRISFSPCPILARVGAGSAEIARWTAPAPVGTVVLGIGSNDPVSPVLARDLARTRAKLHAARVIWILPYHRGAAATVERVATTFGDYVIDLAELPSGDRLHPRSYHGLAIALQRWSVGSRSRREGLQFRQ